MRSGSRNSSDLFCEESPRLPARTAVYRCFRSTEAGWHAVALISIDRLRDALPVFRRAFLMNPSWWLLIPRLVEVGLLPDDPEVTEAIQSMGPTPAVIPDAEETLDAASADSPDPGRR